MIDETTSNPINIKVTKNMANKDIPENIDILKNNTRMELSNKNDTQTNPVRNKSRSVYHAT